MAKKNKVDGGRRQLTDVERELMEKQLPLVKEELAHIVFLEKHNSLMIDEGLESNFKQKLREYRVLGKNLIGERAALKAKIGVMREQLEKGVKVPAGVN